MASMGDLYDKQREQEIDDYLERIKDLEAENGRLKTLLADAKDRFDDIAQD